MGSLHRCRCALFAAPCVFLVSACRKNRHFNLFGGRENKKEVLAGLESATGFIRSKIGKQLKLRFVPTIEFFYDETQDEAQRIEDLLKQVKQ